MRHGWLQLLRQFRGWYCGGGSSVKNERQGRFRQLVNVNKDSTWVFFWSASGSILCNGVQRNYAFVTYIEAFVSSRFFLCKT
jgi:hypothetical protein